MTSAGQYGSHSQHTGPSCDIEVQSMQMTTNSEHKRKGWMSIFMLISHQAYMLSLIALMVGWLQCYQKTNVETIYNVFENMLLFLNHYFFPCNYLFGDIDIPTTVSQPWRVVCLVGRSSGECWCPQSRLPSFTRAHLKTSLCCVLFQTLFNV